MDDEKIRLMPKIELHVHLEGSVEPATLLELAAKHGVKLPATSLEEIAGWYQFSDFGKFIEVYLKISECIKTPADIEFIAKEFLRNQKRQNVLYSEVIFTPYNHHLQKGLGFPEMIGALGRAKAWGRETLGIDCNFIMDVSREVEGTVGAITAKWILDSGSRDVVALGLGGPEIGFPPERHATAFDLIRGTRVKAYPHAGETVGPASVWGALTSLGAARIAHGVRSWEDPALVEHLVTHDITIDVCPTSNICLKVYPDIEHHVLPKLVDAGVRVTIGSDDPPMFGTTLVDEYRTLARVFGYGEKEFHRFNKTAIEGCFLGYGEKKRLEASFDAAWQATVGKV
jgi:adenosine deaminase